MASELLNCSICPKEPSFSDISHLLTHVNSKSHLSHLHKLQIRSYIEVAAGTKLSNYNQWYQQHELGQMLSNRMVQKETKKTSRKSVPRSKKNQTTETQFDFDKEQPFPESSPPQLRYIVSPSRQQRKMNKRKHGAHRRRQSESPGDQVYKPYKRSRHDRGSSYLPSPMKEQARQSTVQKHVDDYPVEIDPSLIVTPNHKRLKGIVWPGMAIFDSATLEEQRLRNQKKDGSVVRRMERLSRLVIPAEAVYSPGGTMRKQRHIDDLEDDISLIEGETPIPKKNQRTKRKLDAKRSPKIPRLVKRKPKARRPRKTKHLIPDMSYHSVESMTSSPTQYPNVHYSRFSPTADDNKEFKLTVGKISRRKKSGYFTIFDDNDQVHDTCITTNPLQQESKSFIHGPSEAVQPRPSFLSAPWLQPQNQHAPHYNNQYTDYCHIFSTHSDLYNPDNGKENVLPTLGESSPFDNQILNPLVWRTVTADRSVPGPGSEVLHDGFQAFFTNTANLSDPFGITKNPLLDFGGHLSSDCVQPLKNPGQIFMSPFKTNTTITAKNSSA